MRNTDGDYTNTQIVQPLWNLCQIGITISFGKRDFLILKQMDKFLHAYCARQHDALVVGNDGQNIGAEFVALCPKQVNQNVRIKVEPHLKTALMS